MRRYPNKKTKYNHQLVIHIASGSDSFNCIYWLSALYSSKSLTEIAIADYNKLKTLASLPQFSSLVKNPLDLIVWRDEMLYIFAPNQPEVKQQLKEPAKKVFAEWINQSDFGLRFREGIMDLQKLAMKVNEEREAIKSEILSII
jgi:hypothetical protein